MTNDSKIFKTSPGAGRLLLYEGKMVHQYTHLFAQPRYWIEEKEGRKSLLGKKEEDGGQQLDYQGYRIAFRDIARNTDERTMIASVLPPGLFAGNTLIVSRPLKQNVTLAVTALLDSFTCDFLIRQKVTAHCNMFYVYQLPVPRLTEKDPAFRLIVERAARLICTTPEFDDLAKEAGIGSHKQGVTDAVERARLRAELDGLIAHLYGLTEEEFTHVLASFPLVAEPIKIAAQNAYRDVERGLIK
jgi:hypothetical protein